MFLGGTRIPIHIEQLESPPVHLSIYNTDFQTKKTYFISAACLPEKLIDSSEVPATHKDNLPKAEYHEMFKVLLQYSLYLSNVFKVHKKNILAVLFFFS